MKKMSDVSLYGNVKPQNFCEFPELSILFHNSLYNELRQIYVNETENVLIFSFLTLNGARLAADLPTAGTLKKSLTFTRVASDSFLSCEKNGTLSQTSSISPPPLSPPVPIDIFSFFAYILYWLKIMIIYLYRKSLSV